MGRSLVIVESPAKARTIKKYVGDDFEVIASVGHIKNLPDHDLGVDVDNNFAPNYEVIRGKRDIVRKIKSASKIADDVYLAPDPDREGEAIAWHIAEELGERDRVHRILINEITPAAVKAALDAPLALNRDRYNAQQTRRILDRLVGYQISPLLWKKVRQGLSAGRVQSVALKLIAVREAEIKVFIPREFWRIVAQVAADTPPEFTLRYHGSHGKRKEIGDGETANGITDDLRSNPFIVKEVKRRKAYRKPPTPFITSRLQQEASRKLRFTPKKTMHVAQSLYEGIDLETGAQGLITYMRTDSTRLGEESLAAVRQLIDERYGAQFVPDKPNLFAVKKSAQDAHEAIRPTDVRNTPDTVAPYLTSDQLKLYRLIWNRFVACQMKPAVFEQVTVSVACADHELRVKGSVQLFAGFTAVYTEGKDNGEEDDKEVKLPKMTEGRELRCLEVVPSQHFTEPPPRYTDSTLIRDLEDKGIGRPSTYAMILSNIQDREYVRKRKGRLHPTDLGMTVNMLLGESFPDIINETFTAELESRLDSVAEGTLDWQGVLVQFYDRFEHQLEDAKTSMRNIKREGVPTEFTCDKCEKPMVLKWGRNGQFLACSGFPDCRNTMNVEQDEDGNIKPVSREVPTDQKCEKCGSGMVIKHGRYGKFLACSGFPECRNTQPLQARPAGGAAEAGEEPEGELPPCPKCGSPTIRRRGRYGTFVACSAYPKCKTIVRSKGDDKGKPRGKGKGRGRRKSG